MPGSLFSRARVRQIFQIGGFVYAALLVSLIVPVVQRHLLYLHAIKLPLFASFDVPVKYGMPVDRTFNIRINTTDGVELGAWFLVPFSKNSHEFPSFSTTSTDEGTRIDTSITNNPTVIFFHGNAATRAMRFRVQHYLSFSNKFNANVLVIDYRGYADSQGLPDEQGLKKDGRAAWNWVTERGAHPQDVLIVGHSLGTAVSAALAAELASEEIHPRGVVLLAPFSSLFELLDDYQLGGIFPLFSPLKSFPWIKNLLRRFINHPWETISVLPTVKAPILIAHAQNDWEIPYFHSERIFEALLDPLLPELPPPSKMQSLPDDEWKKYHGLVEDRKARRDELVITSEVDANGTMIISRFNREKKEEKGSWYRLGTSERGAGSPVVFLLTKYGGHDKIGIQESVADVMGHMFF